MKQNTRIKKLLQILLTIKSLFSIDILLEDDEIGGIGDDTLGIVLFTLFIKVLFLICFNFEVPTVGAVEEDIETDDEVEVFEIGKEEVVKGILRNKVGFELLRFKSVVLSRNKLRELDVPVIFLVFCIIKADRKNM